MQVKQIYDAKVCNLQRLRDVACQQGCSSNTVRTKAYEMLSIIPNKMLNKQMLSRLHTFRITYNLAM